MRNILIIAAHPDDETLGCGGTIAKHIAANDQVTVLALSDGVSSRAINNDAKVSRHQAFLKATELLGCAGCVHLDFPDNAFDTLAFLEIVKAIEKVIDKYQPSIIYTHNNSDLNLDHRMTYRATMTACRPIAFPFVKQILCYEILSSTEWAFNGNSHQFCPNYFVNINEFIEKKINALTAYIAEIRDFPHPRSIDGVKILAAYRGMMCGVQAAEAFFVERMVCASNSGFVE